MTNETRGVQSIEIGARLLHALAENGEPMMLKELSQQTGIAPAQAHAYLVSFRKLGLVEQEEQAGRYRFGPFALDLGITRMRSFDPFRMANEAVIALSLKARLTVALVVWGAYGPTVIQIQEGGDQVYMTTRVGTVYSLTGTASGRVFAAFMPSRLVRELMSIEKRVRTPGRRIGRMMPFGAEDIEQIKRAGYATIEPPPVPGINAVSAPVFDHVGQMQFALTLVGPASALEIAPDSESVAMLLASTRALSVQLGYKPAASLRLKAGVAHHDRQDSPS